MSRAGPGTRSPGRLLAAIGLACTLAVTLGACGGSGADALGHQACASVDASLRDLHASATTDDPARRTALTNKANAELRAAFHPAELAAESSGDWEALGATLEELQKGIPASNLVTALSAQCASNGAS